MKLVLTLISALLFCALSPLAGEKAELFTAASVGALSSVEEALESDFNVNSADELGNTAILLASENGHMHIVKYLIKVGADVDRRNVYGYSPLFSAVINAHVEVIKELLASGADIELPNIYGSSAKEYISALGYENIDEYMTAVLRGSLKEKTGPNTFRYLTVKKEALPEAIPFADKNRTSDNITPKSYTPALSAEITDDPEALYLAGKSLTDGVTPKDAVMGNIYLQRAYELGDIRAAVLCGRSYLMGLGVPADYEKALELFNLGVLKGNEDAKFFIGLMKYFGVGTPEDRETGTVEMNSAAQGGSEYALEQAKRFITEDALDYLRIPHHREEVKSYLLSMGASLEMSEGICDLYSLQNLASADYSLERAKICFPGGKQEVIFEHLKDIDPLYKARLDRYAADTGSILVSMEHRFL
ncbi:MAG: ankyrin repeat domain-containing protein [Deferribacteraceae bacterium]|jgi:hypothetical protein|nr:ankyrin repeat domain-containing protein [Deferribacteraceae bacterium]